MSLDSPVLVHDVVEDAGQALIAEYVGVEAISGAMSEIAADLRVTENDTFDLYVGRT